MANKIRRDDEVVVLAGKDKGKTGNENTSDIKENKTKASGKKKATEASGQKKATKKASEKKKRIQSTYCKTK